MNMGLLGTPLLLFVEYRESLAGFCTRSEVCESIRRLGPESMRPACSGRKSCAAHRAVYEAKDVCTEEGFFPICQDDVCQESAFPKLSLIASKVVKEGLPIDPNDCRQLSTLPLIAATSTATPDLSLND